MSLGIEAIGKIVDECWYPKKYRDIPFLILLTTGKYAVRSLDFKNGFVKIKYQYKCITEDGEIACFRFASDARLAAKYNDWEYVGI